MRFLLLIPLALSSPAFAGECDAFLQQAGGR
jgi:hypothetical protein